MRKKINKILLVLMCMLMLSGSFEANVSAEDEHTYQYDYNNELHFEITSAVELQENEHFLVEAIPDASASALLEGKDLAYSLELKLEADNANAEYVASDPGTVRLDISGSGLTGYENFEVYNASLEQIETETNDGHIVFDASLGSIYITGVAVQAEPESQTPSQAPALTPSLAPLSAAGNVTAIESFGVSFQQGATYNSSLNAYIWDATRNTSNHSFSFRISYSLSGEGNVEAGAVQMRIPANIIKDRNGNYADIIDFSVPRYDEIAESDVDVDFVYRQEGNEYVIYNCKEISAASNGFIEVMYSTTKNTMNYVDMGLSEPFHSSLSVGSLSADSQDIRVGINSNAKITSAEKRYPTLYKTWQSSWGSAPADANDYYYLVWEIVSYIDKNITQPYNLTFNETVSSANGSTSVAGYKFSGQSSYGSNNTITDQTRNEYRYDYVLTKHTKADFSSLDRYSIANNIDVVLTPVDLVDAASNVVSGKTFSWERPEFKAPSGSFNVYKRGDGSYRNDPYKYLDIYNSLGLKRGEYSRYDLEQLKENRVSYLDDFDYVLWLKAYPYPWTLEGDATDPENYGINPVTYELVDEGVYLSQDGGEESDTPLTSAEFDIYGIRYAVNMYDAVLNEDTLRFSSTAVTYTTDDVLTIYLKFGDNSADYVEAGTIDLYNNTVNFNSTYIDSIADGLITPKENCVAFKIVTSNAHYYTEIDTLPLLRIKNTRSLRDAIADFDAVGLKNTGSLKVSDHEGNVIFEKSEADKDFARVIQRDSFIEKEVVSTSNNKRKKNYAITWKTTLKEEWTYGQGEKGYINQESGIFYDLLPKGMSLDPKSVAVETQNGYLDDNAISVDRTYNYQNTGRELLKIEVKESGDYYNLYFDTIIDWDNLRDFGTSIYNPIAYRTGNEDIKYGSNDDGGSLEEASLMANLTAENDGNRFVYDEEYYDILAITAATAGLTKKVKAEEEDQFTYDSITHPDGNYQYRLRYMNSASSQTKNLVFYDSLENYSIDEDTSDWHGILQSVDVSHPATMGASPVIYLSDVADLDLVNNHDLSDSDVWTLAQNFGDITNAKAVAVDLRKKSDGSDFVLNEGQSVSITLNMKAPSSADADNRIPVAYNNIYISDTVVSQDRSVDYFIHHDYTTIGFVVRGSFKLHKTSSKDNSNIRNIRFRLFGTSDYGTEVDMIIATDINGMIEFRDVEKGRYILSEYDAGEDWIEDHTEHTVYIDDAGDVYIDQTLYTDQDQLELTNDPRIHADIGFVKKEVNSEPLEINLEPDVFDPDTMIKYAVSLYGIGETLLEDGSESGLTFGPALGADYVGTYHSHEPSGSTRSGNEHRCIHNDSWSEIVLWNNIDPNVYEQCISEGCTHSVYINKKDGFVGSDGLAVPEGDGPSTLFSELSTGANVAGDQNQHLRWNPINKGANYGTNIGGWGASRIRAMLNGADELTMSLNEDQYGAAASYYNNLDIRTSAQDYSAANCLFDLFPDVLKNNIGKTELPYNPTYNSSDVSYSYDKLWLLAQANISYPAAAYRDTEGGPSTRFAEAEAYNTADPSRVAYRLNTSATSGTSRSWWLHSPGSSDAYSVYIVNSSGYVSTTVGAYNVNGVSPCFSLAKSDSALLPIVHPEGDSDELSPEDMEKIINNLSAYQAENARPHQYKLISDTGFKLTGTSDYGTEYSLIETSDASGKVSFKNIEQGSYILKEIKENEDFLLDENEYHITIDENGIISSDLDREALYYVNYNTPRYWSFPLIKADAEDNNIWLEGATITIDGTSDLGTEYHLELTSDENGIIQIDEIEKGTYILKETVAPTGVDAQGHAGGNRNYQADPVEHVLTVSEDGFVKISGLSRGSTGEYMLLNSRALDGKITVYKKWIYADGDTLSDPVLTLTTYDPQNLPTYKITYDANGGSFSDHTSLNSVYVTRDGKLSILKTGTVETPSPADSDYMFTGWSYDQDGTQKYSPTDDINGPITVYANYKDTKIHAKYAVSLYGIGQDVDQNGNTMGLTFGPALGADYVNSYKSHTPTGTTASGNAHRCIHDDDWETIVYWNSVDPNIYEQCISEGCTHSIDLRLNETLANSSFTAYNSGDGPSMLYQELLTNNTNYQHLEWNPLQATGSTEYGNNVGGWGASRIRAMMNGADSLTQTGTTYGTSVTGNYLPTMAATDYNTTNSLFSCFPAVLQNAIGSRKTIYHGTYNSTTQSVCYDKLFLLSMQEVSNSTISQRANEGSTYTKFASGSHAYSSNDTSRIGYMLSSNTSTSGTSGGWWLRSPYSSYADFVCGVYRYGDASYSGRAYRNYGVSPCFSLSR